MIFYDFPRDRCASLAPFAVKLQLYYMQDFILVDQHHPLQLAIGISLIYR
jgi:hypothetical protein